MADNVLIFPDTTPTGSVSATRNREAMKLAEQAAAGFAEPGKYIVVKFVGRIEATPGMRVQQVGAATPKARKAKTPKAQAPPVQP